MSLTLQAFYFSERDFFPQSPAGSALRAMSVLDGGEIKLLKLSAL